MKILADSNMPLALEAFSTLGETTLLDGRLITPEHLRGVDLLFTRSTTKINAALLEHADRLKFYGSAVIGTDHIDIPLLERRKIPWSAAPGCNAESVAQYVTTAMLLLARKNNFKLRGKTLGLVGAGNVGQKIINKICALGMDLLICDPPLLDLAFAHYRDKDPLEPVDFPFGHFESFSEILPRADILTLHVPLNTNAADPCCTHHLLNAKNLRKLKRDAVLINAARGPVVDNAALLAHLNARPETLCALDTWEGEPRCDAALASRVHIATPHIAGYSHEGKVNGTRMVYEAACRSLGIAPTFEFPLPPPPCPEFHADAARYANAEDLLCDLCLATYDLPADDAAFRASFNSAEPAKAFDLLRANYPYRREFSATRAVIKNAAPALQKTLRELGFM